MAKTLAIHPLKRMPRSALVVPLIAVRSFATKTPRLEAVDLARGIAVLLMILSHGVKGLLTFDDFPDWGLVPVHLITKFSSTLFILVFGISLAVAFVPFVGRPDWPKKRRKLLVRGLVVLFWYKVLTIVEMFHLYEREEIVDTLLYKTFPSYVEILGFYALALLWIPFVLGAWRSLPLTARIMTPFILAAASAWLHNHFHFWGNDVLKALLVEHRDYYTWGQLARAPLIFLGLLIGEGLRYRWTAKSRTGVSMWIIVSLFLASALCFTAFSWLTWPDLYQEMRFIAFNRGKHPPDLPFMLFSMGGATLILAASFLGGNRLAAVLRPITLVGKDAMGAFVFHIFVIFVIFRFLLDYFHKVTYMHALGLTIGLMIATPIWLRIKSWTSAR